MLCTSCNKKTDHYKLPSLSSKGNVNAVIEIPAGTNKKFEYNKKTRVFEIDKKNGKDRVIEFLPYLGNYGFIPSTYSDPKTGGDGDAMDVLVLSENVPTGTVMEIKLIGMLKLLDKGEIDYKIIAVPNDTNKRIININSFNELTQDFPKVKTMIELWFLNYNKEDKAIINGWVNEKAALEEIYKNKL